MESTNATFLSCTTERCHGVILQVTGFNPAALRLLADSLTASLAPSVADNPYIPEPVYTPTSGDLLPYLPTYQQNHDTPTLDERSVNIPTFIRYAHAAAPPVYGTYHWRGRCVSYQRMMEISSAVCVASVNENLNSSRLQRKDFSPFRKVDISFPQRDY